MDFDAGLLTYKLNIKPLDVNCSVGKVSLNKQTDNRQCEEEDKYLVKEGSLSINHQ